VKTIDIVFTEQKEASGRAAKPTMANIQLQLQSIPKSISAAKQAKACERAAMPGLAALKMNVNRLGRVTGNLARAPGIETREYTNGPYGVGLALVGFVNGRAMHAHLVEFGTKPRTLKKSKVFSSWQKRGKWIGPAQYPTNFVMRSRSRTVGAMPAFHPVTRAYESSLAAMQNALKGQLETLVADATQQVR
jgi:hypothetical protein